MNTTVKIYDCLCNKFNGILEISYKEYRMDGSLYSIGDEQLMLAYK